MVLIVVIAAICVLIPTAARLLVSANATAVGVALGLRAYSIEREICAHAKASRQPNRASDHKPTCTQRHLLRAGLKVAIRQTELRSLFPDHADSNQRIARQLFSKWSSRGRHPPAISG